MNFKINTRLIWRSMSEFLDYIKCSQHLYNFSKLILLSVVILVIINISALLDFGFISDHRFLKKFFEFTDLSSDFFLVAFYLSGIYFASTIILFAIFLLEKKNIFLFFSLLGFFLWFSVAFRYHQRVGEIIQIAFDLNIQGSFLEFFAWMIAFIVFFPFFIKSIRGLDDEDYGISSWLFISFVSLCFFAIFIDYVHESLILYFNYKSNILTIVEEGGELLSGTLMLILSLSALFFKFEKSH